MKQLITILLCLFTLFIQAQNTNDTTKYFKSYDYGFSYKRLQAREAFIMPTDTVINKLGAVSLNGAIYLGNGVKWTSIGGSGTTPTLQQVTNAGATTTNGILVNVLNLGPIGNSLSLQKSGNDELTIANSTSGDNLLVVSNGPSGSLRFGGSGQFVDISTSPSGNVSLNVPSTSGTIALTSDTTNQFVKRLTRTPGKDSIIYFVGANRFAIKDSVGTNPAPVGYYGAFQDTTIQTAIAINTPYAMKLGVTDLSNGVSIVSNTRIKIANAGVYNIQFSAQFDRTNSGTDVIDIWLRKNGNNVSGSGGKIVMSGGATSSQIIATWNYVLNVSSNDYFELMWSTPDTHVRLLSEVAQTSPFIHPQIPSLILTVTQQSGIMAGTGISPLDTANMLIPYASINLVNTKLNISDTSSMLSSYSTRINGKLNITDTANMLFNYAKNNLVATKLNISDTASMLSTYNTRINGKLNISDTGSMLFNYARTNLVATKLNISDTATMLSSYSTRINGKLNISDTTTMLSKYLRKIDTATLSSRIDLRVKYTDTSSMLSNYSTRINGKLNITDTSTLQRKSIPSYTFLANNTTAAANATTQTFKDTSGVYDGTITWTGTTAPSGATNHSYRLTQIGKCVTLNVVIFYATNALNVSAVTLTLPSNAPTPIQPTGLTSALQYLYPINFQTSTSTNVLVSGQTRGMLRNNTANNGFEMNLNFASISINQVNLTLQYWTN
jgi:hypothetical protein